MLNLLLLDSFLKVAESGSISAAARTYQLPKSTLSHRLRQLEDLLGVEIFVRRGHSLTVTDPGAELLRHARQIQTKCDDVQSAMAEMRHEVAGTLRIGATGEFGTTITSELLYSFRQAFPQVHLDVTFISARQSFGAVSDMALDGIIHWGEPRELDYISRRLSTSCFNLYASPEYIRANGMPECPQHLSQHRGLLYQQPTRLQAWYLVNCADKTEESVMPPPTCTTNDYWTLKYFAVAGEGIVYLPDFFAETECQSGLLVPVLPKWRSPETSINLVYLRRRHVSRRFRAFIDFCLGYYRKRANSTAPRYFVEKVGGVQVPRPATATPDQENGAEPSVEGVEANGKLSRP